MIGITWQPAQKRQEYVDPEVLVEPLRFRQHTEPSKDMRTRFFSVGQGASDCTSRLRHAHDSANVSECAVGAYTCANHLRWKEEGEDKLANTASRRKEEVVSWGLARSLRPSAAPVLARSLCASLTRRM